MRNLGRAATLLSCQTKAIVSAVLLWATATALATFMWASLAFGQAFTMPPPAGVSVMGCVFTTVPPTLTSGQTGFVQCGSNGGLLTSLAGTTSNASDDVATSATSLPAVTYNYVFDGTAWDRMRSINGAAGTGVGTTAVHTAPTSVAAGATDLSSTGALAANLVAKASPGNLYSFEVSVTSTLSAGEWYVMIFNATSAPSDGAVTPAKCWRVPTATTYFAAAWPTPIPLSTGITIGVGTTGCFTKTASTQAFISADYK